MSNSPTCWPRAFRRTADRLGDRRCCGLLVPDQLLLGCRINFSWFASAYDTDDWAFRVTAMAQTVSVIVLAPGLPPVLHSIDANHSIDNASSRQRR